MLVVGLTGSMGMGKTTVAGFLRDRGVAVFDADAEVHKLYEGAAVPLVERAFPGTTADGHVDRAKLSAALVKAPEGFKRLEAIVHPLVRQAEARFLSEREREGDEVAVLEVPLLYETGLDAEVDAVIVVTASAATQRKRLMDRPGMTLEKLEGLLKRQTSDVQKRRRADFVVETNGTLEDTAAQVDKVLESLQGRRARAYRSHWYQRRPARPRTS